MSNHPNRVKKSNPTAEEISAARLNAGLSQTEAGKVLHTTCRVWQQWEYGTRRMHPAFWELFTIKTCENNRESI